jgi:glycine cleavage system H protein
MADSDYSEFGVAHGRKYTLEHLWLQVLDEKKSDSQIKIGLSEFVRAEFGDIIRVILTKPEDDSEFKTEDSDMDEEDSNQDDDAVSPMTSGDEVGLDDLLLTVTTEYEKLLINAPFPCKIVSLNGDIEDNPDLVNDDAYADGWCVIVQPYDFDPDQFLDEKEYIEYLAEV